MKIVRLLTFLDFGGVEKRLTNIASIHDDNEWVFCAINKGGLAEKEIRDKGKEVHCFNLKYKIPSLYTIYKLHQFFKTVKPDVIHTSGAEANFHGILAAKLSNIPVIVAEEIGVPKQSSIGKLVFSQLYRLVDKVIGNSKPVLQYLHQHNKVDLQKLNLVPNPIVLEKLPERLNNSNQFVITSVSRLVEVKNIAGVIHVIKMLVDNGYNVIYNIVGSGPLEEVLNDLVKELTLSDRVNFLGFQKNPYNQLTDSDLYIINSFTEGFSNSLIEAMYCGIPSVSTRCGSAEEVIADGENGWLVKVDDQQDLYLTIKKIIEMDNGKRSEVGRRGKMKVEKEYSLQQHIASLMNIYSS